MKYCLPITPPTELEKHREILNQFSPRGEGAVRSVYLTFGTKDAERVRKVEAIIEKTAGVKPDVVSMPDITEDNILKEMKYNHLLYQLIAIRGFNGQPNARRIVIPAPKGNAYLKDF